MNSCCKRKQDDGVVDDAENNAGDEKPSGAEVPEYLDSDLDEVEEKDPLVAALERGLGIGEREEGYDADSEDELELLEQESEVARMERAAHQAHAEGATANAETEEGAVNADSPAMITPPDAPTAEALLAQIESKAAVSDDDDGDIVEVEQEQPGEQPGESDVKNVDGEQVLDGEDRQDSVVEEESPVAGPLDTSDVKDSEPPRGNTISKTRRQPGATGGRRSTRGSSPNGRYCCAQR